MGFREGARVQPTRCRAPTEPAQMPAMINGSRTGDSPVTNDLSQLAKRLAREFSAPVGLLDSARGGWCLRVGADASQFPRADIGLVAALTASGFGAGRAVVWRGDEPDGPLWLALHVPRPDGAELIALAGFATSADSASAASWGPVCPAPALRAWGQVVSDQL